MPLGFFELFKQPEPKLPRRRTGLDQHSPECWREFRINGHGQIKDDVAVSDNGIELIDREFLAAIQEGREPNGSVHDTLNAMRTLDRIEKSFDF